MESSKNLIKVGQKLISGTKIDFFNISNLLKPIFNQNPFFKNLDQNQLSNLRNWHH